MYLSKISQPLNALTININRETMKFLRYYKYSLYSIGVAVLLLGWASCSPMNEPYKEFIEDGEIIYPATPDSVLVHPGKNRIKLSWLLPSDPSIRKARVYWQNRSDSVEVAIDRTGDADTERASVMLEDMEEGSYTFDIRHFDDEGNVSIETAVIGFVYGDSYINSLLARMVNRTNYAIEDDTMKIVWGPPGDETAIATELTYQDLSGTLRSITVPREENTTVTGDYDFDATNTFQYRTMYLPDSMAIDTFYTETQTERINEILLKNSGQPFEHGEWDGNRWGYPKYWVVNDAVKNKSGYGGFDGYKGGYLSIDKWGFQAEIINGKIYKPVMLPAGAYSFEANFTDGNARISVLDEAYMVVAEGDTIPDIQDVETASLGYTFLDNPIEQIAFTLNQQKKISFGFVATFRQKSQNIRCHSVRLYYKRQ